jgi:ABC-type thiamine transport system ATPase subunit
MPTNRNNNLKFTALSTSRAEQNFSILVEEYDPDIVPRLGNQTVTLDDGKKKIVSSCKQVIEKAVQTKCQFLDQEVFPFHFKY